jgi:hypothetical protein
MVVAVVVAAVLEALTLAWVSDCDSPLSCVVLQDDVLFERNRFERWRDSWSHYSI